MIYEFKPLERIDLYGDNTGYVELWPSWIANISDELRMEVVTKIASISYGNDAAKNPEALFRILKEKKHNSLFEFILSAYCPEHKNNLRDFYFSSYETTACSDKLVQEFCDRIASSYALFKIKIPVFVDRQFVRHRMASRCEQSRRYVKNAKKPFEFYKYEYHKEYYDNAVKKYEDELANGMLPEEARMFIPTAMYTEMWWMNNFKAVEGLKNFFTLRMDSHAQKQIIELANAMYKLIENHQPVLFNKIKLN